MSKFCIGCGTQLDENAVSCPSCGTPVAPASTVPPFTSQQAPAFNAQQPKGAVDPKAIAADLLGKVKKNPLLALIPVSAVVFVIVVSFLASLIFNGGYNKAIDNMMQVMLGQADEETYRACAPEDAWEYVEDEYDVEFDDIYDEYQEYVDEDEHFEEMEDAKVSFKIKGKKKCSEMELSEIKEYFNEDLGIRRDDVKKAYYLNVQFTIKQNGETEKDLEQMVVVKIGSDWYCGEIIEEVIDGYY